MGTRTSLAGHGASILSKNSTVTDFTDIIINIIYIKFEYFFRIFKNLMDTIIQTDKSFLNVHQYTLDEQCIKDVSDKLLENPEIEVYGKRCYQHRSIGFFSDESLGYKYSRKFMKSQPLSSSLKELLNTINSLSIYFSASF